MRFELNFAAVVRNVAVLANVAILAVDRFVAVYRPVHHAIFGYGTTHPTGQMRPQSSCDPCQSRLSRLMADRDLAYVMISPEREITTKRWRQERLLSKPRG
jgi:hypothetical protein